MMRIVIELTEQALEEDIKNCGAQSLEDWKDKTAFTIESCAFPSKVDVDIKFIHEP